MPSRELAVTRGLVAIVDEEDYERVSQFKWCAIKGRDTWYAHRTVRKSEGLAKSSIRLHHFILGMTADIAGEIDHRNGNGLDNRKQNLRMATAGQNRVNSGPTKRNTSGFKGVTRHGKKWHAQIRCGDTNHRLGSHPTPEAAARVYDAKARELFGEFAYLNFPDEQVHLA